jgi:hypothetical protein
MNIPSELVFVETPVDGVEGITPVRPGRTRGRINELPGEKAKPAAPAKLKKQPPRKAPARGRFVDEYARPPA